jgi:hypothetical protein
LDNLPFSPPSSSFLLEQVEQETLHSIVEGGSEDYEEFLASKDRDSRFCMGKFWRTKVFLDIEASVDDESFDDAKE